jgi:hypothetical protein
MSIELKRLLEAAKVYQFSPAEKEEHRRSFAYGNTKIENSRITRELIDKEAENLRSRADIETRARV